MYEPAAARFSIAGRGDLSRADCTLEADDALESAEIGLVFAEGRFPKSLPDRQRHALDVAWLFRHHRYRDGDICFFLLLQQEPSRGGSQTGRLLGRDNCLY